MKPSILSKPALLLISVLILLAPPALWAGELVNCKYVTADGNNIRLEITVKAPPPASIIFVQRLPKGVGIKNSSPRFMKFNKKRGEAKWLLKQPKPGTLSVNMTLDNSIKAGSISGEVRYKDTQSGRTVNLKVKP